ncbi:tat pathway signal sequence [Purpureocillium lilacinum]|uniref:Tat pathway signal sequence n=1 Tax=Purpureocillium lilacinum TaxID=33203 RepID=A0A179GE71_PURLI|nr:tat pathway signal sequence [Purpureocillium lilacinum]OAQ75808.1 tat pathway signal sequence [Purpureocillium lilacinum]OAQ80537.1 tat pathway signal sequence [Purpureocillium lilacinum]
MAQRASDRASDEVPFLADEEKDVFATARRPSRRETRWARLLPYSGALNLTLLVALIATWALQRHDPNKAYIPNEIYSPAQSAVEYETVVFTGGLRGDKSKFQGSSSEVDAVWDEMYNDVLISAISPESAAKLPNATTPFTYDTDHYIIELDVFHQLHCLNMLRKLVYPDAYKMDLTSGSEEAEDNIFHMEHCYEQLRQSLQCSSDISTIYWEWSEKKQRMFGNVHTTHTCRNFEKIRDWAVEHHATTDLDFSKHVKGAPLRHD